VLRIFYIEYFSTFGGDFAPIVVRIAWLLVMWGCVVWNELFDGWRMMNNQTGRCHNVVL
jgi:hypothetical protein